MEPSVGIAGRPLRVAIIGAGPSGFYAAGALTGQKTIHVSVDIFDRLPTPFGLVRHGVAPDHQKIKTVTKAYEKTASDERVRFFGNISFGKDLTLTEFHRFYDAIIFAIGAAADRKLGIPGEELEGSYSATDFVAWYNGHPDYASVAFDLLQAKHAVVIGNGNVAVDVARILARSHQELVETDIAEYALEVLRQSPITEITMVGRRGPAQAAFTNPELRELGELETAEVIVDPHDLELDPHSAASLADSREAERNMQTLRSFAERAAQGEKRHLNLRFLLSPVEIIGENGHVVAIRLEHNRLEAGADGAIKARGTGHYETIPADIVFRAIGYRGVPLPDMPYDARAGIIPNQGGRIWDPATESFRSGEYVVGWAKRGPTGIIGTNKPDAVETVKALLAEVGQLPPAAEPDPAALVAFLQARQPDVVTYRDWQLLDGIELERGQTQGRPRIKFHQVNAMLDAIRAGRPIAEG